MGHGIHKKVQEADKSNIISFPKRRPIPRVFGVFANPSYKLSVRGQLEVVVPQVFLQVLLQIELGLHRKVKAGFHLESLLRKTSYCDWILAAVL